MAKLYFVQFLSRQAPCYETIMNGRVTHMRDTAAMRVRSLFTSFDSVLSQAVILCYRKRIYIVPSPVFH